jgi:hypothetical protein
MQPFNPYEPPRATSADQVTHGALGSIRAEGKYLIFPLGTFLPDACVKCGAGQPTALVRRRKNYVFVPWYGRLFGVIGALITRRRAAVELPLCVACDARYRSAVRALWMATGVPFLGVLLLFIGLWANVGAVVGGGFVLFLGGLLAPLIVLFALFWRHRLPLTTKIDKSEITLLGVHPRAVEFFVSPGGGR